MTEQRTLMRMPKFVRVEFIRGRDDDGHRVTRVETTVRKWHPGYWAMIARVCWNCIGWRVLLPWNWLRVAAAFIGAARFQG